MMSPQSDRTLTYAAHVTREDVRALEMFLNTQLDRVSEEVGETGETSLAMRSLLILVSDSVGLLQALLRLGRRDPWPRAAIVREWQRRHSTAHPFNHCDGFDRDPWWKQVRHYEATDERAEQERSHRLADDAVLDERRGHGRIALKSRLDTATSALE
ncbi:hypothetical protein ACFC18_34495 [Streptomyces sp. NPDC056121]|uniref:hypothetical protein n=1 Tax=Streptomyces sp. NPDC056121 TaxID=3345718 RepID=UPI0035D74505